MVEDISGEVALYDIDYKAAKKNEIIGNKFNSVEIVKVIMDKFQRVVTEFYTNGAFSQEKRLFYALRKPKKPLKLSARQSELEEK